jgi:hypothetical protein
MSQYNVSKESELPKFAKSRYHCSGLGGYTYQGKIVKPEFAHHGIAPLG